MEHLFDDPVYPSGEFALAWRMASWFNYAHCNFFQVRDERMWKGKRCPSCNKRISAATAKCRHCGSRIQELLLKTDPIMSAPLRPPGSRARPMNILFYAVVIGSAAVGGIFFIRRDATSDVPPSAASQSRQAPGEPQATQSQPQWPVYRTTAADLYNNYAAYEAATNQKTGRTAIEISGTIKAIDHNLLDESEVDLDAGEGSNSVALTLDKSPLNSAQSLVEGRYVRIRCENMSFIQGSPSGQSCELVE